MRFRFPRFDKVGMPLLGAVALILFVAEARRQLRKRSRPQAERLVENSSVAAAALPALRFMLVPAMYAAARWANKRGFGVLPMLRLPQWVQHVTGFVILDYTNYLLHVLLHKSEWLWRFHNVHHIDLDLDLSTAWRFHVGENLASVPYRSGVVALLGVPADLVLFYEVVFEGCTAFHHSNVRLPINVERRLCRFIVTPRMHGIHHSIVAKETNSNFSVIFSCWDRLHRTLCLNVPQDAVTIGVPSYRDPSEQSAKHLLLLPFQKQRPWQLPDGTIPERSELAHPEELMP